MYKYSGGCVRMPSYDDGCCGFVLTAIASGDTTATVQFGNMSASIQISSYLPLKVCSSSIAGMQTFCN